MQRKFLTNLVLLLFLNLIIKPFWIFGIDLQFQNLVGTEAYGFYFTILNFSFLFNIILDLGITNFNIRNIAQNSHLLHKHFSNIFVVKLLLLVVYFIFTMITGLLIGYDQQQLRLLAVVGFNQFLLSFILYLRSNISGLLLFKTDSILSVLDRVFMILLLGFLIWYPATRKVFKLEWFVYAQTVSYLITVIIGLVVVIRKSAFKRLNWNWPFILMIVKKSFPYAILVLLMTSYNRVDSVFIERLLPKGVGETQVGIYASAFRILDAVNMVAYLFSVLLLPLFANMLKNKQDIRPMLKLSFTLVFVLSVSVAILSFVFRYEVMTMLYPLHAEETTTDFVIRIQQAARLFGLLMFGFVAISSSYVMGTLLTAHGSLLKLNLTAALSMICSVILNLVLVPSLMAFGSGLASLVSQYISAAIQIVLVIKVFKINVNYGYLVRLIAFLALAFLMASILKSTTLSWVYSVIISGILILILVFSLKLLDLKLLIHLLQPRPVNDQTT
ncbi:MAG TPA: hypothetical protein DEO70_07365 [Bacteroidales bacterium]|nr:MAG: hypothetical protein A2X11_06985 [Bacteroidetes bacterium GWE2_42_24]OFY25951.1 MAG: hypothetical protein A2X09_04610 [Bacteroidetes bacterium GWF2_43_11]HBZ66640.1 hypothetical protein [Bacteroidales bacterium]